MTVRRFRLAATGSLLLIPLALPLLFNSCDCNENADGTPELPPSIACAGSVSVTIPAAFAAPAASSATNITMGGTATGCVVYGVSLYNSVPAASVGTSYAAWTATVPLTTVEAEDAGKCGAGTLNVPVQVLVTDDAGINNWVPAYPGCVPLLTDQTCSISSVSANVTGAFPAPASSSAASVVIAGTLDGGVGCPVTGLTVDNAYTATPLVPGYGAWTATLPLTVLESMPSCNDGGGYELPIEALVPQGTGLSTVLPLNSPCAMLAPVDGGCPQPTVSVTGAVAAPAGSGSPSMTVGGTVSAPGCPIAAMTLLNAYTATAVAPDFVAWTASVPLAVLSEGSQCSFDAGGVSLQGFTVSAQLLVPGATGLTTTVVIPDAGCVPAATTPLGACATATPSIGSSYLLDGGALLITGTVDSGACPVSGLVLLGGYAATAIEPNYTAWSATVPLAIAVQQPCATPAPSGDRSVGVPLQLVVPGQDGLPVVRAFDGGCATFASPDAGD